MDDPWMTDAEIAAALLRRSAATVARMRASGAWPFLPGRPPLSRRSDVLRFMEARRLLAAPTPQRSAEAAAIARGRQIARRRWAHSARVEPNEPGCRKRAASLYSPAGRTRTLTGAEPHV